MSIKTNFNKYLKTLEEFTRENDLEFNIGKHRHYLQDTFIDAMNNGMNSIVEKLDVGLAKTTFKAIPFRFLEDQKMNAIVMDGLERTDQATVETVLFAEWNGKTWRQSIRHDSWGNWDANPWEEVQKVKKVVDVWEAV